MTKESGIETPAPKSRDEIRAQVFSSAHKVKSEQILFFGSIIEIRQPTLGGIIDARSKADGNVAIVDTLVERAYVPGTDTKVFEETDADGLKAMPFGADFIRVTEALTRLTEVNFPTPKLPSEAINGNT